MTNFIISVVSHKQNNLTNEFLASLDKYLISRASELLVVITQNIADNVPIYEPKKFHLLVKYNLQARGFGENHNHVYEQYRPSLFMIMNPDVKLESELRLNEVYDIAMRNPGIYSPVVLEPSGEVADFRRKDLTFKNLLRRMFLRTNEDEQFDWFAGMSMLVTGEVFEALSGFDERFYMYVEDCDICMRARSRGFSVEVIDNIQVVHDARRASRKNVKAFTYHIISLLKYWLKKQR